jgi:hypothetical protein
MAVDAGDFEAELAQFTGTQHYYRNFAGLLYTDGIRYLAEEAGAFWLIDLVGSYQRSLGDCPFQVWNITVHSDRSALVTMVEDDDQPLKISQRIPFTDFPLRDFSFYCCVDELAPIMLLKSEY